MIKRTMCGALALGALAAMLAVTGCGGDDETTTTSTSSSSGAGGDGSGGSGGDATNGSGGDGGASSSTASGSGGDGVGGGGGGGGDLPADCLDASDYDDYFTVADGALCVVAVYDADVALGYDAATDYSRMPTWGKHHGPLTLSPDGAKVTLERWQVPSGAKGTLTKQTESVDAALPAGAYLGAQAVDLPFFDWTAISWTAAYPGTDGEVILLREGTADQRYDVSGLFSASSIASTSGGRLLYTGLSLLGTDTAGDNGLYAADPCGTGASTAERRLLPEGDATCRAPAAIATWGENSGPVAVDSAGNVFAAMTNFSDGTQEARGFAASAVAPGGGAASGDGVLSVDGFGMGLAAIAPAAAESGILAFQASDADTYQALDVVAQRYTVADGKVTPASPTDKPTKLLKLTQTDTAVRMFTGDGDRLWAGVDKSGGGSLFFVLARKP